MAKNRAKGWFRTRQQTKGEVVYYCHYSTDPATGILKEKVHKLGPVAMFPDADTRWQEVGRLGLTSFIDNPVSDVTFEGLVKLYIDSGAIGQKTLSQKKASGTVAVIRHNLEAHCMPRWRNTPVCTIDPAALEEWLTWPHPEKADGMGCFISGLYARQFTEAAMVGYVHTDTLKKWQADLRKRVQDEAQQLRLEATEAKLSFESALPLEWSSTHSRPGSSSITLFHLLLDCRKETVK